MDIIRYINGQKLSLKNLGGYIVESDVVLRTIAEVNKRAGSLSRQAAHNGKSAEMMKRV